MRFFAWFVLLSLIFAEFKCAPIAIFAATDDEFKLADTAVPMFNRTLIDQDREFDTHIVRSWMVGGMPVDVGQYPWFAMGIARNGVGCAGSLITPEFVLTAAHCVLMLSDRHYAYEIGAMCPNDDDNCGQHSEVILGKRVFIHPDYDSESLDHDFALVKLKSAVSKRIEPVRFDKQGISKDYIDGKSLWTAGLGRTSTEGDLPIFQLRHVDVSYEDNGACGGKYGSKLITASMMCASDPEKDSCQGDSGGPLYDAENKVLVGLVSWVDIGCAFESLPGVYSRAAPWIEFTICTRSKSGPPPPDYICGCKRNESRVDIYLLTDSFGEETEWKIIMSSPSNQYLIGRGRGKLENNQAYYHNLCVPNGGTYRFVIKDHRRNGLDRDGKYALFVDGVWNKNSNKKFKFKNEFTFTT